MSVFFEFALYTAHFFHIISKFAQNITMAVQIVLICLETIVALTFLPMQISLTGHVSLARSCAELDVKLFAFRVVKTRVFAQGGRFNCTVNGKKPKKSSLDPMKMIKIAINFQNSDVRRAGVDALKIGLNDAMKSAAFAKGGAYISETDSFELDIGFKMRINLLQVAEIAI